MKKGLINYDMQTVKSIFCEGMNKASLKAKYCNNAEEELKDLTLGEKSFEIDEIISHFNHINNMLKDKMYKEKAEDIFKNIPMKMEVFYEKFDKECMTIPILKYYEPYQFFQRLSCANNEDIVTIKEKLLERAKKYGKELEPELKNVIQIKNTIDEYVKGKNINIKIILLTEFSKELEYIISKYDENKEENN